MPRTYPLLFTICLSGFGINLALAQSGGINLLPEFGRVEKSHSLLKAGRKFIDFVDANYPDRKAAATYFAAKSWTFVQNDGYTTAIKRFNQA